MCNGVSVLGVQFLNKGQLLLEEICYMLVRKSGTETLKKGGREGEGERGGRGGERGRG